MIKPRSGAGPDKASSRIVSVGYGGKRNAKYPIANSIFDLLTQGIHNLICVSSMGFRRPRKYETFSTPSTRMLHLLTSSARRPYAGIFQIQATEAPPLRRLGVVAQFNVLAGVFPYLTPAPSVKLIVAVHV